MSDPWQPQPGPSGTRPLGGYEDDPRSAGGPYGGPAAPGPGPYGAGPPPYGAGPPQYGAGPPAYGAYPALPPQPYGVPYPPYPPPSGPRNGFGVTALVCGLIGALFGAVVYLFALTAVLGIVALIFGLLGIGRANRHEATNRGVAVVGTALGVLACVLSVVGLVTVVHRVERGVGKVSNYVQCVADIPSDDPQRDIKLQHCGDRFN